MTRNITTVLSSMLVTCLVTFTIPGSALAGSVAPDGATTALSGAASGFAPTPTVSSVSVAISMSGPCQVIPMPPSLEELCELFVGQQEEQGSDIDWEEVFRYCTAAGNEVYFKREADKSVIYMCTKPK